MGTITLPSVTVSEIKPTGGSLLIGSTPFPTTDSTPRSRACFGGVDFFVPTSIRQEVLTSTADIDEGVNIVGVIVNGPVNLNFVHDATDIYIVDEGGLCDSTNTITVSNTLVSVVLDVAYGYMRISGIGEDLVLL